MATTKTPKATQLPKLTATEAKTISRALEQTLKSLDPKIKAKLVRFNPRVAALDVNICGTKCF